MKVKRKKSNRRLGLRARIRVLWASLTLLVPCAAMLLAANTGRFPSADRQLQLSMEAQLKSVSTHVQEELNQLAGRSLKLSERISGEIENQLLQNGRTFRDLDDDPQALAALQQVLYAPLDTMLHTSKCSGAYAVLDTTANTQVPEAEYSRSGLYLRRVNMTAPYEADPDITFFRGIPEVARQKNIELHNRWNLEFDTDGMPGYAELVRQTAGRPADHYFWTERLALQDTWEEALLLCVPVIGNDGTVYGMCGADVSALFFMLAAPVQQMDYGPVITVLAPMEDGRLMLNKGLIGGVDGSYLDQPCGLSIHRGKSFNTYAGTAEKYIGVQCPVDISQEDGAYRQWAVAMLLPDQYYQEYRAHSRSTMLLVFGGILLLTSVISLLLYWKIVSPLERSLGQNMKCTLPPEDIGILVDYLAAQSAGEPGRKKDLPEEVSAALERFYQRAARLSEKEKQQLRQLALDCAEGETGDAAHSRRLRLLSESIGTAAPEDLMLYLDFLCRYTSG